MSQKLYKSKSDIVISGVCGGIAEYFGFNPTAVRIIWVLFSGGTLWLYIVLAILMPKNTN